MLHKLKSKIKSFLISKLTPDYYRLKTDNELLNNDIKILIGEQNESYFITLKKHKILNAVESCIWFGDFKNSQSF